MLRASLYIIVCSAKNRIRMRLRRLREARYLVGAIAGAAYLYFAVFARMFGARTVRTRRVEPPELFASAFLSIAGAVSGIAVLIVAALAWLLPAHSTVFEFSEAETHMLFPAPVSRRQLLIHRLMRSQLGLLFASIIASIFVRVPQLAIESGFFSVASRLRRVLPFWIVFVTIRTYFGGVTLARARLMSADPRVRLVAWAPLAAILGAVAIVAVPIGRVLMNPGASAEDTIFSRVMDATSSGFPHVVLAPFAVVVRPLFAPWPGPYLLSLVGAAAVVVVVVTWVVRTDEAFLGTGDETGESRPATTRTTGRRTPRARSVGWALRATGRTETVFLWKNAMHTVRTTNLMTALPWVVPLIVFGVFGTTARMSATGSRGPAASLALGSLMIAGFCALLGPQTMRTDLRGDLPHLELLKTWPMKAAAVIRGELLWSTIALTIFTWLALVCGTIFSAAAFPQLSILWRLSLSAAAMLLAPTLICAQLTVHNASAVLFPAWVPTGNQRPRGLDALGQRLILFAGVMLALIVLVGPGAIAGGIVIFAFLRLIGPVSLIPAAIVCLGLVAIEILLVTEMLGAAYDRIDLSQVERTE